MKVKKYDKNKCGIYLIRNLINGKVYIGKSINIYKMLLLQDTENALVQMRLGQALGKAKKFEEGIPKDKFKV